MRCQSSAEFLRLVDGGVPEERGVELREHATKCPLCRGHLEDVQSTIAEIASVAAFYSSEKRRAAIREALDREIIAPKARRSVRRDPRWFWGIGAGATLAAALSLVVALWPDVTPEEPAFQARDGAMDASKWVGLRVFRLAEKGATPRRVVDRITAGDWLLFSYTNLDPAGFGWVAIVALDASGRVHWLHPTAPKFGEPAGLTIRSGVAQQEIPEAVRVPLAPGSMRMAAVFSLLPLRRDAVEGWLMSVVDVEKPTPLGGTAVHLIDFAVDPRADERSEHE